MANDNNEINKVKYPGTPARPEFDTVRNWPATTQVTQTTGEDITRNRDALLVLERVLGPNPHIGLFTADVRTASVSQRIGILEQGVSEGRFEFKRLKVENAIDTIKDVNQHITLVLGAVRDSVHDSTLVEVIGPLRVRNSNAFESRALFDVGIVVEKTEASGLSTDCEIIGSSQPNIPLLKVTDYQRGNIQDQDHIAVQIDGNLRVSGFIEGQFALDHSRLNNINTDPVIDAQGNVILDAIHVSRGNYHTHKRGEFNPSLNRWIVDPNPTEATYGIIDHSDLEPQSIRTTARQTNFIPNTEISYHVTNGDDHDHVGGDGAPLRHSFLLGIDPQNSDHVSGGDTHSHDPEKADGAPIHSQSILLEKGQNTSLKILALDDEASLTTSILKIDELLAADRVDIDQAKADITNLQDHDKVTDSELTALSGKIDLISIDNNTTQTSLQAVQVTQSEQATSITALQTNTTLKHQNSAGVLAYSGVFQMKTGIFTSIPTGATVVAFQSPFPNATLSVVAISDTSVAALQPLRVGTLTTSTFVLDNQNATLLSGTWIAIGH
jgi:hypothetical protein